MRTGSEDIIIAGIGLVPVGEHWETTLRAMGARAVRAAIADSGGLQPQGLFAGNAFAPILSHQANPAALIADEAGLTGIEVSTLEAAGASGGAAVRAAVVETLTSIPRVQRVTFFVGTDPLTDANGNLIGSMTADTFVQNPGEQINSFQEAVVQLYFSNLDGDALVPETQQVHYSSNISMEKLVIERLLAGPLSENLKSAIPAGTQLLSVTAVDGVCYVNFDDALKNQDYEVQEAVVIYSIVDSLLELDGIGKVQISINGDTSGTYRDKFSLSTQYEANYDLVEE